MMHASLDLFLAALVAGLGFGLGWSLITWLFGEIVALAKK